MMRCYVYVPQVADPDRLAIAEQIHRLLDQPDIVLLDAASQSDQPASAPPAMSLVDAMVIEGTVPDQDIGFLLAHAIAERKPVLYLYQRGTVASVFRHLAWPELPSWIHVVAYSPRSLSRHLEDFLLVAGGKSLRPTPRIKFTLRLTGAIEDYLNYKTLNTKTSKADWVREVLERLMADDGEWQSYLRRRGRTDRT